MLLLIFIFFPLCCLRTVRQDNTHWERRVNTHREKDKVLQLLTQFFKCFYGHELNELRIITLEEIVKLNGAFGHNPNANLILLYQFALKERRQQSKNHRDHFLNRALYLFLFYLLHKYVLCWTIHFYRNNRFFSYTEFSIYHHYINICHFFGQTRIVSALSYQHCMIRFGQLHVYAK